MLAESIAIVMRQDQYYRTGVNFGDPMILASHQVEAGKCSLLRHSVELTGRPAMRTAHFMKRSTKEEDL